MAIAPQDVYPGQVATGDTGYPHGKARNVTTPGDGTGTPWEERLVNDVFGFQQDLLDQAGLTPSGTPDRVGASQYVDAVRAVARDEATEESDSRRDANGELVYPAPRTRLVAIAPAAFSLDENDVLSGDIRRQNSVNAEFSYIEVGNDPLTSTCWFDLRHLPFDATITRIRAAVFYSLTGGTLPAIEMYLDRYWPNFTAWEGAGGTSYDTETLLAAVSSGAQRRVVLDANGLIIRPTHVDNSSGGPLAMGGTTLRFRMRRAGQQLHGVELTLQEPGPRGL